MTLPSSGPISASQISVELGRSSTATLSLNCSAVRALAGVPSGTISYSNFYGKSTKASTSYVTPGLYSWVAPTGVTSVSVVAVGGGGRGGNYPGGGGGGGAGLGYRNNISVTPGTGYTLVVGRGGCGGYSSTCSTFNVGAPTGQTVVGYSGLAWNYCCGGGVPGCYIGSGGGGGGWGYRGGGGAGGYSGSGGAGGTCGNGAAGSGGGGGGAAGSSFSRAGGGGVGLFGQGCSGAGGTPCSPSNYYGRGGSGGGNGTSYSYCGTYSNYNAGGAGGAYGGGSGPGVYCCCYACINPGPGGNGAIRVMWPGNTRSFPSTCACATGESGSISYLARGTYTWIAPVGVTSVSAVAVGQGGRTQSTLIGGAGGGGLGYKNNISVTPGTGYTVRISCYDLCGNGDSYFINGTTVKGGGATATGPYGGYYIRTIGGTYVGDGGGNGGNGGFQYMSGGGAGGYSGNGGRGATNCGGYLAATAGSGGGGGGGARASAFYYAGAGGGVGLFGQGANGAAGTACCSSNNGGKGGSGGSNGGNGTGVSCALFGGVYGGGGGGYNFTCASKNGGSGAVRIVWPGNTRQFPSTNVCASKG